MTATALRLRRLVLYIGLTLPLMPVQALLLVAKHRLARRLPRVYHSWSCRVLGFRVRVSGVPQARRPTLFVANHTSYADIEILGGLIEGCFVSKTEVAKWPLWGWLAKLQQTVFIDRRIRSTAAQRDAIQRRLDEGHNLILLPEGTTGDGNRVMRFKSELFSVADYAAGGEPLPVQPVSVAYARLDGMPLGRFDRPHFAWYGDMEFAPHFWNMLGRGTVGIEVTFHPPVTLAEFPSRKALADHCHRVIAAGVATALAGRPQAWPTAARSAAQPAPLPVGAQ